MKPMHMTLSEVKQSLMDCGLRDNEARKKLKGGCEDIPPHPHKSHSHRRWLRSEVERYCSKLKAGGETVSDCGFEIADWKISNSKNPQSAIRNPKSP